MNDSWASSSSDDSQGLAEVVRSSLAEQVPASTSEGDGLI
jgi:hypothetical protein